MSSATHTKLKTARRIRRKKHVRRRIYGTAEKPRLSVSRSHKNISCQVIDDTAGKTLAAVSSQQKEVREQISSWGGNCDAAKVVGKVVADRIKSLGIESVQFDRNGYRFLGRVKALVESAREAGLSV